MLLAGQPGGMDPVGDLEIVEVPREVGAELGAVVGRDFSEIEVNDEARPFSMNKIGRSHQPHKTIDSEHLAEVWYFRGV